MKRLSKKRLGIGGLVAGCAEQQDREKRRKEEKKKRRREEEKIRIFKLNKKFRRAGMQ